MLYSCFNFPTVVCSRESRPFQFHGAGGGGMVVVEFICHKLRLYAKSGQYLVNIASIAGGYGAIEAEIGSW
jgi:hypothetical protein